MQGFKQGWDHAKKRFRPTTTYPPCVGRSSGLSRQGVDRPRRDSRKTDPIFKGARPRPARGVGGMLMLRWSNCVCGSDWSFSWHPRRRHSCAPGHVRGSGLSPFETSYPQRHQTCQHHVRQERGCCDFGLAKNDWEPPSWGGTPWYISPEFMY